MTELLTLCQSSNVLEDRCLHLTTCSVHCRFLGGTKDSSRRAWYAVKVEKRAVRHPKLLSTPCTCKQIFRSLGCVLHIFDISTAARGQPTTPAPLCIDHVALLLTGNPEYAPSEVHSLRGKYTQVPKQSVGARLRHQIGISQNRHINENSCFHIKLNSTIYIILNNSDSLRFRTMAWLLHICICQPKS